MRPEGCEAELLRALASMPFLDRLEMVAVSGWSRGAVYEAVEKLESGGWPPPCSTRRSCFPRPGGSTSPPRGCAGLPMKRAKPSTSWCAPIPYPRSGGAA